jgi:hypothetical protein
MRKIASVILLLLFLFNMVGYRAWFYYAEKQSDAVLEASLDNQQYNENDLVSLTVPLDNPYQLEQTNFERVNGEISFCGKTLKYVKRKVSNGNLILLCIPDMHKMVLKKAKSDYGNSVNDLAGSGKNSSKNNLQKNFNGNDYTEHTYNLQLCNLSGPCNIMQVDNRIAILKDPLIASMGKPPRSLPV